MKTPIWKKCMHPYIYHSIIYSSQNMKITEEPIGRWLDKEDVVNI